MRARCLRLDAEARTRLALGALDALPPEERALLASHIEGCATCAAEAESLARVVAELALASPPVAPPLRLRARLRARLEAERVAVVRTRPAQVWKDWAPGVAGPVFLPGETQSWEESSVPGVSVRRLSVDASANRATMLVRMQAGASYPAHRHGGPEECYVLEGDLASGLLRMRAGDYQRVPAGSSHGVQSTDEGCLLLIVSALDDELLADGAEG